MRKGIFFARLFFDKILKTVAIEGGAWYNGGMLTAAFPKLGENKCTRLLRAFFRSPVYALLIAALMACAEIFAIELTVYWIYLALGCLCLLFCEDTLGLLPITCCAYMTFAYENSPHAHPGQTFFSDPAHMMQLVFIIAVAVLLLIGRLIVFVMTHPARRMPMLTVGFMALGAAYLLSGVGYEGYVAWKGLLIGALQILSLCALYFYYYFSVDWEHAKKSYIFTVFIMVGLGMLAEIGCMYLHEGAIVWKNDVWTVNRGALGTGWGVYNNVGGVMAMCVPAPFYFAAKNDKWGWAYALLGCLFMLGVAFTQSRGAILFGAVVFAACALAVLIQARGGNRIAIIVIFGVMLLSLGAGLLFFRDKLGGIFSAFTESGMDSSGRWQLYKGCWDRFKEHPFLGVGFHNLGGEDSGGFAHLKGSLLVPPRAHNTIFQLIATGGIVALLAYLFHRGQTVWLWLRRPTYEKTVAAFIVGALLLTSLLDCHFFNYGPGLLYGTVLAYAECTDRDPSRRRAK